MRIGCTACFSLLLRYEGEFRAGELEGRGEMNYRDGQVHRLPHLTRTGEQILNPTNVSQVYVGQFKNWRQEGRGVMTYRNGDKV